MQLRRGVILSLTLIGILLLVAVTADWWEAKLVLAGGSWLLALVYAQVTQPREER
jgi:hypothetical protein